ncbi:aryl-sulfate sulfotransferase [Deinococcus hohokamensis]|uniref:Aryl-sulfate sulfotransferase n=1 Tax=Deinococcus hohokamensis TaxID=309883 RepID=A0ABV9IEF1_9DEIO
MKVLHKSTVGLGVTMLISACSLTPPLPPALQIQGIQLNPGPLYPEFDPTVRTYEAMSLSAVSNDRIYVKGIEGQKYWLNGKEQRTNTWVDFRVPEISSDSSISIALGDADGTAGKYSIATQPGDFPKYSVKASNPTPGNIFVNVWPDGSQPPQSTYLLMMNHLGKPLYYLKSPDSLADFKGVKSSTGAQRYIYHWTDPTRLVPSGGEFRILDDQFRLIKLVKLKAHKDRVDYPADLHDFLYIDDDHYITLAYYARKVLDYPGREGLETKVMSAVIQEVDGDRVVFDWESSNIPALYKFTSDSQFFKVNDELYDDYAHINSVAIDPKDGNIIASFRHLDSVLKINRKSSEIMWRFGGKGDEFNLSPEQQISHQHTANYGPDGHLVIFDNGNASNRSRVVDVVLDETNKRVLDFRTYSHPNGGPSLFAGSAQKINATTFFVGWGGHPGNPTGADVSEIDTTNGQATFEMMFPTARYSYRAFKMAP